LPTTDSGEKQENYQPPRVRIATNRFGRALRLELIRAHSFTQTSFGSVKTRSAAIPPSRPTPDSLTPPNGVRRSRSIQQLTQTIPLWSCAATRWARDRSRVHSDAARP